MTAALGLVQSPLDKYTPEDFEDHGAYAFEWDAWVEVWDAAEREMPAIAHAVQAFRREQDAFNRMMETANQSNSAHRETCEVMYSNAQDVDQRTAEAILRLRRDATTEAEALRVIGEAHTFYAAALAKGSPFVSEPA